MAAVARDPVRDLWVPMRRPEDHGARISRMVAEVVEHSTLTTTQMSVPVGRAEGPVPYIAGVTDRLTEYQRYW